MPLRMTHSQQAADQAIENIRFAAALEDGHRVCEQVCPTEHKRALGDAQQHDPRRYARMAWGGHSEMREEIHAAELRQLTILEKRRQEGHSCLTRRSSTKTFKT